MPFQVACRPGAGRVIADPASPGAVLEIFSESAEGAPSVVLVTDPPYHHRPAQRFSQDVVFCYVAGEQTVAGVGRFVAGELRWVRAGADSGAATAGPQGVSWWVISAATALRPRAESSVEVAPSRCLPAFTAPIDWPAIDDAISRCGAAVVRGLISADLVKRINGEADAWLGRHSSTGLPSASSEEHNDFLGRRTRRIHGLCSKLPSAPQLIGHPEVVAWAERMLLPRAASVLLNSGELIELGPGEKAQPPHRDTEAWHRIERGLHPVMVNTIIALSRFTRDNGATYVAPGSHTWREDREPAAGELLQAEMEPGDALLFRGDAIHCGGENRTAEARRGLSLSYCAGWLRPYENSHLNVPLAVARTLPAKVQDLLGYALEDALAVGGRRLGLYENGDPHAALEHTDPDMES